MNSESLVQLTVTDFLDRLASSQPTPGGGSVAALTGAQAAALGRMVAAFTIGKPKYAAVEAQVQAIDERLARAGKFLRALIDEDAAAYGVLNDAFKLDKTDPQRHTLIQQAAGLAGSVPLETAALCAKVLADLETLATIGNPLLRSDAEAGTHLARAALHAAAANVRANLLLMTAEDSAAATRQLDSLLQRESTEGDASSSH